MQRAQMGFVAFDTLKYAEKLEKSGFSHEQSVVQAEAQAEILTNLLEEKLATKDDLKQAIQELRSEIKQENHDLRIDLYKAINSQTRWMVSALGALGLLMAFFKFYH